MKKLAVVVVTLGLTAAPAEAHDLTCSKSQFSHWPDLRGLSALVADDKPRVECVQVRRNKIKIIGSARGSRYVLKQWVVKVDERTYGWHNSPFYHYVHYWVSRPVLGTHG